MIGERLQDFTLRFAVLVALLAVWWFATGAADSIFFPLPTEILPSVWTDWLADGDAWTDNIIPSLVRMFYGFLLAAVGSILLGLAIGRSKVVGEFVEPIIHFVRAIPPPALLPLFLVLLGIGDLQKVVLIAVGVFPPILLNTIDGVRSVEQLHLDTASAYQIPRPQRVLRVILPSAAPKIFAGLRISLSVAVILMVISELFAATDGIGFRIVQASRNFSYVELWSGIVVLGLLGILLNAGLGLLEMRVLRWSKQ